MKPQLLLVWLFFVCACGAQTTADPGDNGGNTNWLTRCDEDAECGGGDGMCVAEVCLKPCRNDDACDGIANTECRSLDAATAASSSCESLPTTSLCALRCDRDADCSGLGDAYACEGGVCAPTCPSTPAPAGEPSPDAGSGPGPNLPGEDECVLALDASQCCAEAFAARRSEFEGAECWYEVVDGDYTQPSGLPDECFTGGCPAIPCPNPERPGWHGVAVEDEDGACVIEPVCDDASCPGSACDPAVGCDPDWVDPVNGLGRLQCEASACGEPGTCVYAQQQGCGEIYAPVCGCDGVTYDNRCSWGELAPILHEGECAPIEDECVMAIDASQCCAEAFPARRSELETAECWYEVIDGDYTLPSDLPSACYPSCPDIPCAPPEAPGWYGTIVEDAGGSCAIEPTCNDASCPGSACDPAIGCDRDWVDPTDGIAGLLCEASACGEPGTCAIVYQSGCDDIYDPVCGCDGVTYDNRCSWGYLTPILHAGECEAAPE